MVFTFKYVPCVYKFSIEYLHLVTIDKVIVCIYQRDVAWLHLEVYFFVKFYTPRGWLYHMMTLLPQASEEIIANLHVMCIL